MTHYKQTHKLTLVDASYIAGLIDGEGTVTLTRKHKNENRQLAVSISNTEMPLLDFVLQTVGTGKITNKRVVSEKHTPSFVYAVYNRQALDLLEQFTPYLRTYKYKRATIILKNYINLTARNGKYSDELIARRREFEQAVLTTTSKSI